MKPLLLSCIVLLVIGCKKAYKLEYADILLPNEDSKYIALNKVKTRFSIEVKRNTSDTIGFYNYDKQGRFVASNSYIGPFGSSTEYKYDDDGLLIEETHTSCQRSVGKYRYEFCADSMAINQYKNQKLYKTYYFDDTKRIYQIKEYDNYDYWLSKIYYNAAGQQHMALFKNVCNDIIKDKNDRNYLGTICLNYYSKDLIDSTVSKAYFTNSNYNYTSKAYFENGLLSKSVSDDTTIYIYKYVYYK